jgi:hypothetical protein
MWCKRYFDIGALDLQIEATKENIALFKEGRYITRDDDDAVFVIRSVSVDTQANHDNHLIVGGVDVKSILNQRIVWNITTFKGNVEDYIFKLVNENIISPSISDRRIDGFFLGDKFGVADTITQQVSYKPLDETVIDVCKKYDLGWKIELDEDNNFIFSLYRGVDRSQRQDEVPPVIFSPEFDNLASSKYKTDSTKFKNVALVGGEGEGVDRKTTIAGGGSGLDRFEMFVDNASSSTNTGATLSNAEYLEQLKNKGESELAKNTKTTDFEGEVVADSFRYKIDYDLGDTVTVSNEFGVTAEAKIVEIVETWDNEGYSLEPIFEFSEVSELVPVEEGVLLAENGMALMTLGNRAIVAEQPEEYTEGVRISELELTSELYGGCCFPIVQDGETKRVTIDTLADSLGIDEIQNDITALKNGFTPKSIIMPQGNPIRVLFHKQSYDKDVLIEVCAKLDGDNLQSTFNCRFSGAMYIYRHACVYDYLGYNTKNINIYPIKISNNGKWNGISAYGVELKNNFTDNYQRLFTILSLKINGVVVNPNDHVSVYNSTATYMTKGSQCTANTANGVIYLN